MDEEKVGSTATHGGVMPTMPHVFLTAEWKHLAMLNYEVEPTLLNPFIPAGTELDSWNGRTFVSMVGFLFQRTRVLGLPIPFHCNFEEVNLRFYVRRKAEDGWRRGVVFIKEIVPRTAIAFVARTLYNEPYIALPMSHQIQAVETGITSVEYQWRTRERSNRIHLGDCGPMQPIEAGSEAELITEHYWGYNRQRNGTTMEYQVEHPRWRVAIARETFFECDIETLYGARFVESLSGQPSSSFLAEGSAVKVYRGVRITR